MCCFLLKAEGGIRAVPVLVFFFFQAEAGIRDVAVTGVQTCALPISCRLECENDMDVQFRLGSDDGYKLWQIGRAAGRERGEISGGAASLKKKKKEVICAREIGGAVGAKRSGAARAGGG